LSFSFLEKKFIRTVRPKNCVIQYVTVFDAVQLCGVFGITVVHPSAAFERTARCKIFGQVTFSRISKGRR